MTEREKQLISDLEAEKEQVISIENIIKSKQNKLKESKQKVVSLELAIKEEQLNSIRAEMDRQGIDFEAFRAALEKGLISNAGISEKKNPEKNKSDKMGTEESNDENE